MEREAWGFQGQIERSLLGGDGNGKSGNVAYSSWALKTGAGQGTSSDAGKGIPGGRNSESRSPAGGTLGFGRLCQAGNEMDADSFFPVQACGHPQSALNHSLGLESSDSSIFLLFPPSSGKGIGGGGLERGGAERVPRVMNPPHLRGSL